MSHPLSAETLARLKRTSTATLTTQMFKRGFRNIFIQGSRPLRDYGETMVGPAVTLRYIPAREDLDRVEGFADPEHPQRKAIENAPAGSVLVMDCRRETGVAAGGQILMTRLWKRGVAGMVSDGCLRDTKPIAELPMPVYCAGPSAPLNLAMHHAVDINQPIACGGVAVYPGDIMVGDTDGVVVLPAHMAEQIAADAAAQEHMEVFLAERIAGGAPLPGTYPPNEATKALYVEWCKARGLTP